ncbi:MAG: hypothetical protein R3Y64_05005 [Peptostreptococcaceae bacterium]
MINKQKKINWIDSFFIFIHLVIVVLGLALGLKAFAIVKYAYDNKEEQLNVIEQLMESSKLIKYIIENDND